MGAFHVTVSVQQNPDDPFITYRRGKLFYYHELCFVGPAVADVIQAQVLGLIKESDMCWMTDEIRFIIRRLSWDSTYFGQETFKIVAVLFGKTEGPKLLDAFNQFVAEFMKKHPGCRLFIEVPAEDVQVIQGLTSAGLRQVESRVIHFRNPIVDSGETDWRIADKRDTDRLGKIARDMRNEYDRVHADILIPDEQADAYLETYARACTEGFTDTVVVPDEPGVPSNSFIAINLRKEEWLWNPWKSAQIVLAAVDSATNKGWYKRLVNGTTSYAARSGAGSLFNTTQLGNRAVIHVLENCGFKFGGARFILST